MGKGECLKDAGNGENNVFGEYFEHRRLGTTITLKEIRPSCVRSCWLLRADSSSKYEENLRHVLSHENYLGYVDPSHAKSQLKSLNGVKKHTYCFTHLLKKTKKKKYTTLYEKS
ncbi:hypothetical protein XENORESO_006037 [Xenotaenia resolanae]|uniref:Uncharacterized protein n=1 Tax=Xenotaenia resolanae TaxID=208358 RepID=A0ABV0W6W7_9TELE